MSKEIDFDMYVRISGIVEVDEYNGDPNEMLDAVFPDGWEGEIWDAFTDPSFMPRGSIEVTDIEDEDEDEEADQ